MERLDDLSLRHISRFLDPEDIIRVVRTCKRMYSAMPRVVEWRGKDFKVNAGYYCRPELYFDGPELSHTVQKLNLSVTWHDQGWGNRKGELWLNLMRRPKDGGGEPAQIASYRPLFGIAEHFTKSSKTAIQHHPVVTEARPGDFYRFMRHVGGGGGHSLKVWNFRVVATL